MRATSEMYAHAPAKAVREPRPWKGALRLMTVLLLLAAAALCVLLLLRRARATALRDECFTLADEISELSDERARLTIEYEGLYSLAEIEDYAENVLGMVPRAEA